MELGGIGIGIDKMELTPCLTWAKVMIIGDTWAKVMIIGDTWAKVSGY